MIGFTRLVPFHRQCIRLSVSARQMSADTLSRLARIQPYNRLFDKEKHKVIYDFPPIKYYAGFLRVKYTLPVWAIFISSMAYQFHQNSSVLAGAGILCFIQIGLFLAGTKFFTNTVGKIYVNKKGKVDEVIISVVEKSGRRCDYKHSLNGLDVLDPYTRVQEMLGIVSFVVKDSESIYKLHLTQCEVFDTEAMKAVIGEGNLNTIKKCKEKKK